MPSDLNRGLMPVRGERWYAMSGGGEVIVSDTRRTTPPRPSRPAALTSHPDATVTEGRGQRARRQFSMSG
jgi:hypothetical protein